MMIQIADSVQQVNSSVCAVSGELKTLFLIFYLFILFHKWEGLLMHACLCVVNQFKCVCS